MKIGKFAKENSLSIDTIRHYMDLGLIVPEKQGGQYFFDSRCQKDLEEVLDLKRMGFSLHEIKSILLYRSLSKLTPYQEDLYFRQFFMNKLKKVERDIIELADIKQSLELKLKELDENVVEVRENSTCGINIQSLHLFQCLKCGKDLILSDASVNNNQIIDGKLKCTCGEQYIINSGILMVDQICLSQSNKFDYHHIVEYVNATDAAYLDNLYKGLDWGCKKIQQCNLDNKVIMEWGSGFGFFLRSIYDQLPDSCVYIAVDHDIERHKFLKSLIEGSSIKKNIIFICSDFLKVPIKEKSADIMVDISGSTNYGFGHEEFLLELVNNFTKRDVYLFGSYILFNNFSKNSLIEKQFRDNFKEKKIKSKIDALQYTVLDQRTSDTLNKGGKFEDYFVEDEKVLFYTLFAKR